MFRPGRDHSNRGDLGLEDGDWHGCRVRPEHSGPDSTMQWMPATTHLRPRRGAGPSITRRTSFVFFYHTDWHRRDAVFTITTHAERGEHD